jgi:hypothetical protein
MDVVTLGAASRDEETNAVICQALQHIGEGDTDLEPFGELAMYGALGVAALPAPADASGACEAVIEEGLANSNGAVIAARDTRTADVFAALKPGETCLHSTGKKFESRVFCKDKLVAIVIGDDVAFVIDKKNKKISLSGFGMIFEMSEANGIVLDAGSAAVTINNGVVHNRGKVILGGMAASPASAVLYAPVPVQGVPPAAGLATPSLGVFIGL